MHAPFYLSGVVHNEITYISKYKIHFYMVTNSTVKRYYGLLTSTQNPEMIGLAILLYGFCDYDHHRSSCCLILRKKKLIQSQSVDGTTTSATDNPGTDTQELKRIQMDM